MVIGAEGKGRLVVVGYLTQFLRAINQLGSGGGKKKERKSSNRIIYYQQEQRRKMNMSKKMEEWFL